jgi:hypothetical protein
LRIRDSASVCLPFYGHKTTLDRSAAAKSALGLLGLGVEPPTVS